MEKNTVSSPEKGNNENAVFVLVYYHIISEKKEHVIKTLNWGNTLSFPHPLQCLV